ncbi:adenosine deaminase, partial [Streptomyces sp. NPDC059441]
MRQSALSCTRRRTARLAPVLGAALALTLASTQASQAGGGEANGPTRAESGVSAYLRSVRDHPEALAAFFRALPKGADLHNHLGGAATTELLLRL